MHAPIHAQHLSIYGSLPLPLPVSLCLSVCLCLSLSFSPPSVPPVPPCASLPNGFNARPNPVPILTPVHEGYIYIDNYITPRQARAVRPESEKYFQSSPIERTSAILMRIQCVSQLGLALNLRPEETQRPRATCHAVGGGLASQLEA